jgi:hypothetical protein
MGKLVRILISFVLLLGFLPIPKMTFAEETSQFDTDLDAYLKEISDLRDFT